MQNTLCIFAITQTNTFKKRIEAHARGWSIMGISFHFGKYSPSQFVLQSVHVVVIGVIGGAPCISPQDRSIQRYKTQFKRTPILGLIVTSCSQEEDQKRRKVYIVACTPGKKTFREEWLTSFLLPHYSLVLAWSHQANPNLRLPSKRRTIRLTVLASLFPHEPR